jgi:hypothetical protein
MAKNNKSFKMAEVKNLILEGINIITAEKWQECINHVIKEEDKMCPLNDLMDNVCDSVIIEVGDDDDDDDDNNNYDISEFKCRIFITT